jgi:hypothetical protein
LSASNCISRCLRRLPHSRILSGVTVNPNSKLLLLAFSICTCPHCLALYKASLPHFFKAHETEQSANPRSFVLFVMAFACDAMECHCVDELSCFREIIELQLK